MNVFDVDDNNHITGLITKIRNLYREFLSLDVAERGAGTSFLDFIKYSIRSKASTDGLTLSMRAATFAAKALNLALSMAVGALIGMAINGVVSAIADYAQRIDTAATKTKEEADAAKNATSSLKDLVDAYEELGDKSGWSTEDFDQAKDIQEELLALAKEQGTLDENKANNLDLQNGKYEEQLGLLKDITEEQLKASESKLIQSKDAQGNKLVKTAKDNNRSHFFSSISANANLGIMNELKDAGIDVFNKSGNFGVKDLNDPDSIAKYYSELGKALDYIVQNTTEAQRAAGGAYHTVYQYLMDEQAALQDDADAYNDSTDAVNENVNARRKLQAIDFWSDGKSNGMDVSYSFDKVNSAVQTLEDTIDGFDASKLNELLWGTNEGLSDEQAQALANLRKALTDMDFSADTNGVNAFIQALVQVGIVAQSSANGVDALAAGAQKMEDISSKMDEIQSAYKASTSAMEEYNQYGYMSLDSLQSLLTMNTEYLNCLELVNGKLQINKQSYAELLAAEYAEAAATILSNAQHEVANLTADDTAESTDDLKEKTEAEKTALENLLPALKNATAATATYSAAQEFANEVEKAGERGVDPAKLEEITNRTNTQLSLLYTNMNAALKGGQALTNQLNGFGSSSKNAGKSSSTTSKSVADLSSAFDTLTKAMKEYNQYGYISADTMKSLIGVDDKFTACLTEQNGKLELNTAKFRTFVRAQLEEANAANDGGKSAGEMKKILDWLNSSVDSETISFEQLTDAIKGYGTAMDEAKEKTDAIKSAFSGFKTIGGAVKNSKIGSAIVGGGSKLLAGAEKFIGTAGSALAAAGPAAIPIAGAAALGIYGGTKAMKNQKKIWSNKEDGFGKKAIKSVASFFWDISPIGAVVNLCKDIFGKSKETAENTKDTANTSSETAENTKKATGITNLTINATQGTISEENKTEESAPEEKKQSKWDKFWGSKFWFWNWGKKASGDKKIKHGGTYNVDEAGPEMLVRQPASGRYTYLETGDGVVPADITSRLFEMGGNPDKWFSDQLAKNGSASMVQSRSSGGISLSIGDVNVNNPVGDSDALASELVNRLPNRIVQQLNKR